MTPPRPSIAAVHLDVLGRLALRRDAEPVTDLLAQPKRTGLLAYIALRRTDGVVSRDELTGVFWPESTEDRARASLRQALRFLRTHLGADLLVNRGDAEIRLDLERVSCDAVRFRRALADGNDEEAVSTYGGELLPGFAVAGSWEFDRWLHGERQRMRSDAVQAALRVADRRLEEGLAEEAARGVRWALKQSPTDESVARRLMRLLDQAGNRAGAVAVFDALVARLEEELELEPSEETVELARAIRSGAPEDAIAARDGSGSRRSLSLQRVLVLGLETGPEDGALHSLAGLAADLLAQGLSAVPDLEVVPPLALGAEADGAGDPGDLARRTGAGIVVGGSLRAVGDRLHVGIRITDLVQGKLREAPAPVVGAVDQPLPALEEMRDRTVTLLAPALTRKVVHVREAVPPPSLDAYQDYLEGIGCFVRGEWPAALDRFRASAGKAPRYALPRVVSAIALWNLGRLEDARAAATEARALEAGLGSFERAVLDGVVAWLDGDWAAAHRAARIQADMVPGSIPHGQVAEEARRLNRPREAREVLSRLDPEAGELKGWIHYWTEITTAHHRLGDHQRELELAHRCRRLHPDDPAAALTEIRALAALGRTDDVVRVLEEELGRPAHRAPTPGVLFREAALELRAHGAGNGDAAGQSAARELLERAVAWHRERVEREDPESAAREPAVHETALRELARTLHAAGELEEARALFRELVDPGAGVRPGEMHHGHLHGHLDQGALAVIAAELGDRPGVDRWSECLRELDRPFLYGAPWYWLAAVDAVEDRKEDAVRRLRRAFAEGMPHEHHLHTDPRLLRLRGYEPFDRLLRPRG